MHRWELDAALDVLTMCSCHLAQSDSIRNEVLDSIVIFRLKLFLSYN